MNTKPDLNGTYVVTVTDASEDSSEPKESVTLTVDQEGYVRADSKYGHTAYKPIYHAFTAEGNFDVALLQAAYLHLAQTKKIQDAMGSVVTVPSDIFANPMMASCHGGWGQELYYHDGPPERGQYSKVAFHTVMDDIRRQYAERTGAQADCGEKMSGDAFVDWMFKELHLLMEPAEDLDSTLKTKYEAIIRMAAFLVGALAARTTDAEAVISKIHLETERTLLLHGPYGAVEEWLMAALFDLLADMTGGYPDPNHAEIEEMLEENAVILALYAVGTQEDIMGVATH